MVYLVLSHSQSNETDALDGLSPEESVFFGSGIGHDVLQTRHEVVVVKDKVLLHSISNCSNGGHYLLQHQLTPVLDQLGGWTDRRGGERGEGVGGNK